MSPSTIEVREVREAFALGKIEGRADAARDLQSVGLELALSREVCGRWRRRHGRLGICLSISVLAAVGEAAVILWLAVGR